MEACDNHQRMSEDLVHLFDISRECPISNPRRCNFGQSKYWNRFAARELQYYPSDRNRDQQRIQQVMSGLSQAN